jgi:hypothetical protein
LNIGLFIDEGGWRLVASSSAAFNNSSSVRILLSDVLKRGVKVLAVTRNCLDNPGGVSEEEEEEEEKEEDRGEEEEEEEEEDRGEEGKEVNDKEE